MRYDAEIIYEKALRALEQRGVKKAEFVIDSMLSADLSGVPTHGIKMLPAYIEKIDRGEFGTGEIKILKQTPSFTVVDANNLIGAVSAVECVEIVTQKAKKSGIHVVFARHCNTLGPAFYYVEKMADEGLIGFVSCNSPAAMPVSNGLEKMLGTNPFAFACPSKNEGKVLLDMATSIVAKSKFLEAKEKGETLSEGWALDCNGNPTTDPIEAIKGFVLPMAGAKGYGIALMIDIMSGMLSGASCLDKVGKFYSNDGGSMDVGQMFVAIDPTQIYDGDFYEDMDNYISHIRSSECVNGKEILIPGDRKFAARKHNDEKGIEITEETMRKLERFFE